MLLRPLLMELLLVALLLPSASATTTTAKPMLCVGQGNDYRTAQTAGDFSQLDIPADVDGESVKWDAGALGPNGKIYATPARADGILELDPADDST